MNVLDIYEEYNALYFDGRLPEVPIIFAYIPQGKNGRASFLDDQPSHIALASFLKLHERLMRIVLLHEMAHFNLGPDKLDGPEHDAELDRLYQRGAYKGLL